LKKFNYGHSKIWKILATAHSDRIIAVMEHDDDSHLYLRVQCHKALEKHYHAQGGIGETTGMQHWIL